MRQVRSLAQSATKKDLYHAQLNAAYRTLLDLLKVRLQQLIQPVKRAKALPIQAYGIPQELLRLASGCSVSNGYRLNIPLLKKGCKLVIRLCLLRGGKKMDTPLATNPPEELISASLHPVLKPGVNTKHTLTTKRRGEEHLANVLTEYLDRRGVRYFAE